MYFLNYLLLTFRWIFFNKRDFDSIPIEPTFDFSHRIVRNAISVSHVLVTFAW